MSLFDKDVFDSLVGEKKVTVCRPCMRDADLRQTTFEQDKEYNQRCRYAAEQLVHELAEWIDAQLSTSNETVLLFVGSNRQSMRADANNIYSHTRM